MKIQMEAVKKSGLRRLLNFFAFTLFIPVSRARGTGVFKLKICSLRVLLGFIIWTLVPLICFAVSIFPYLAAFMKKEDITMFYKIISNTTENTETLLLIFLPICSGKLLHHSNQFTEKELKVPTRKVSLGCLLLLLVLTIVKILLDAEFTGFGLAIHSVYRIVSAIDTIISMFIINMMLSSMTGICKDLKFRQNPDVVGDEALRMISMYRSLKTGLGPILLFFFSVGVFLIISLAYLSIAGPSGYMIYYGLVLIKNVLFLTNLSLACEDCYTEFCATRDIIRLAYFT